MDRTSICSIEIPGSIPCRGTYKHPKRRYRAIYDSIKSTFRSARFHAPNDRELYTSQIIILYHNRTCGTSQAVQCGSTTIGEFHIIKQLDPTAGATLERPRFNTWR